MLRKNTSFVFAALLTLSIDAMAQDQADDQSAAQKDDWSIGGGVLLKSEPYRGVDNDIIPIPLFNYDGGRFQVRGLNLRYRFWGGKKSSFGVVLNPRFDGYEASDSTALTGMQDRDPSLDIGVNYETVFFKSFVFGGKLVGDLLDEHGGYEASAKFGRRITLGRKGVFEPSIAYSYQSNDLVDYYYGVEANEALPTRAAFAGKSASNISLELKFVYRITQRGSLLVLARHEELDDSITSSPIVGSDSKQRVIVGYTHAMGGKN